MILRTLTQDILLKLFSLGVALLLFSFVTVENATPVDVDFPIEYRLGDDIMVTSDPPPVLHATLQGPWAAFRSFEVNELEPVVVDLSQAGPGTARWAMTTASVHPPGGMRAVSVRPSDVEVSLDRRVERQVAVHADIPQVPAFGYEVLDVRIAPARVRVVGPAGKMQALDYVATRAIDITGRESELSIEVDLRPPPPPLRLLDKRVTVFVEIAEELSQRTVPDVPVVLLGAPAGSTFSPSRVHLNFKGPRRLLDAIDAGTLQATVEVAHEAAAGLSRVDKVVGLNQDLPERTQLLAPLPRVAVQLTSAKKPKRRTP